MYGNLFFLRVVLRHFFYYIYNDVILAPNFSFFIFSDIGPEKKKCITIISIVLKKRGGEEKERKKEKREGKK